MFGLGQLGDVERGVAKRYQRLALGHCRQAGQWRMVQARPGGRGGIQTSEVSITMSEPALRFLTLGIDLTDEEQQGLENVHEILGRLTKRRKRQLPVSSGLEAMLREVILYRVVSMAGGTIVNWNTGNVLCSFLSARGLFETFAFLWDYDRAISEARKTGTLAAFGFTTGTTSSTILAICISRSEFCDFAGWNSRLASIHGANSPIRSRMTQGY